MGTSRSEKGHHCKSRSMAAFKSPPVATRAEKRNTKQLIDCYKAQYIPRITFQRQNVTNAEFLGLTLYIACAIYKPHLSQLF